MIVPKISLNETVIVRLIPRPAHVIWSPLFNTVRFATKVDCKESGAQLVLVRRIKKPLGLTSLIEPELQTSGKL